MNNATMLYRAPGEHNLHGHDVEYVIVDADEVDAKLADGWHLTPTEAHAAYMQAGLDALEAGPPVKLLLTPRTPDPVDDNAPPTRAELEQKARDLGIQFDGRTNDRTLSQKIAAKLAA